MTKLAVVAPIWKRDMTVALFIQHMMEHALAAAFHHDIHLTLILVGSEGDTTSVLGVNRGFVQYVECPNQPLGNKFNQGFKAAFGLLPDAVMVLGSDTFFRPVLWRYVREALDEGVDLFGVLDLYMFDTDDRTAVYWPGYIGPREGEMIGACRMLSADLLHALEWEPYDPTLSINLDASMTKKLRGREITRHGIFGGEELMVLSVKEKSSITKMGDFTNVEPVALRAVNELLTQFAVI